MKKNSIMFIFLLLTFTYGSAQIIDKYGLQVGMSYSNQLWQNKIATAEKNMDYKLGFLIFFSVEKSVSKILSIRSDIGYIQKGFKNNRELNFGDGTTAGVDEKNVVFHDIGLNFEIKIAPSTKIWKPFAIVGLSSDYLVSYKDIEFIEPGSGNVYSMYKSLIDDYNKMNLGGIVRIGLEFQDITYIEVGFNPSITSSFKSSILEIRDNCWEIKIGFNMNKFIIN